MKMHLALTAAFVGLCSHAAFAASEGGDTWSELQPQPVAGSSQGFRRATTPSLTTPQGFPIAASEGGDTWSALKPKSAAPSTSSLVVATTAPLRTLRRDYPSMYGTPAEADSADRIVRVSGSARSINVAYGETVTFVVSGENGSERSFAWRFDVSPSLSHVDLDEVAPTGLAARNLRVFVAPDSRYRGG